MLLIVVSTRQASRLEGDLPILALSSHVDPNEAFHA